MLKRTTRSLRGRLAIAALIILLLFLGFTGYALDRAFQTSIEDALLEQLKTQIYGLLTAAEDENGQLTMPLLLQDPELNQIDSGRYALITDSRGQKIWRSPSAVSIKAGSPPKALAGEFSLIEARIENKAFYIFSYGVIWEYQDGTEKNYSFYILQSRAPTDAEIGSFRSTLWRWLGGMGILLLIIQALILRWGLAPLPRLAKDLTKIKQGNQDQLTGDYPRELESVATNLNVLIANERKQRQRYRNTLADLAHSLKTPLAILRGVNSQQLENSPQESLETIANQIDRMDQIVTYQLQRASSPEVSLGTKPIELLPLVEKLVRSLKKVYSEKSVSTSLKIDPLSHFRGDERDLMEVLGNLIDNAFKACKNHVSISATINSSEGNALQISIEDNGPGVADEKQQEIIQRGVRADTSQPGQGIGLAVAFEIITSYGGNLDIGRSSLGGAQFTVELPGQVGL